MLKNLISAFIPIFIAVDALGVLPIFVSLTESLQATEKTKTIIQSLITALCLALGFIVVGKTIFSILGITIADFMVAGGLILFCIAIIDILMSGKQRRMPTEDLGVIPLGTPLITGPAVLTTTLILIPEYGVTVTVASVILNILLVGVVFLFSGAIIRYLGPAGTKAVSKVTSLLLAAIAIMMVRKGLTSMLGGA